MGSRWAIRLVQVPQLLDGLRVILFRGDEQQDAGLVTVHWDTLAANVEVGKRDGCLAVSCLDGGPQLLRRRGDLLWAL